MTTVDPSAPSSAADRPRGDRRDPRAPLVAEPGLELVNPAAGTRTLFTATAKTTGGTHVEVEAIYPPHSRRPPVHHHPSQTELFTVLEGAMTVVRGDETFVAEAGDTFTIPPATPHQMWNHTGARAALRWRTEPALRTGEMFCALWAVAREHDWTPDPLAVFQAVSDFPEEFRLGSPP